MRARLTVIFAALCAGFALTAASAADVASLNLHLHLSGMKSAEPPHIVDNFLVLSASGPYRYVGASFAHEGWREIYRFEKNRYGVFVLAVPVPYGESRTVGYRLVLDGAWAADPVNPARLRDERTGAALSLAELPYRSSMVLGVWDPASSGSAHFVFHADAGQRVNVAGSFNAWDPFIHEMVETSPGLYELTIPLPAGEYHYAFVYKGERIPDPLNRRLKYGADGRAVSALIIER